MSASPTEETVATDPGSGEIVCPTTPWYFRRMGLMFLMVTAFGLWFLKDGLWTYPDKISIYSEYQTFEARTKAYDQLEAEGRLAEWAAYAVEQGWAPGEPQAWREYAAGQDPPLPEEPDDLVPGKEKEQLYFAAGMGVLSLLILAIFLINRPKILRADATSFTTPGGKTVPFDAVFRIDKRKWKNKGLAYAHYKSASGSGKATLDDLKFAGADAILDRLIANFEGELIDRVEPDEEADSEADDGVGEDTDSAASEAAEDPAKS